jgi:hypothetical protein
MPRNGIERLSIADQSRAQLSWYAARGDNDKEACPVTYSGQCLCGAVRFTATHVETQHHACHCGMCRRWSGAPFFGATVGGVVFEGVEHLARYASSDWAERGFCRRCGSSLFYYPTPTETYTMCVGAFDDASAFRLTREIFIDQKPQGYALAGDHQRLTEAETFAEFAAANPVGVKGPS